MDIHRVLDLCQFRHHVFINVKASGCIQDHDPVAVLLRMLERRFGNVGRLMAVAHGEHFHTLLLAVNLQLLDRRRTVYVAGHQKRVLALYLILPCQFGSGRRLTSALKARHHDNRDGASRLKRDLRSLGAHQLHQFFVDDLDHHLARIQPVHHILAYGPLLNVLNKILNNLEVDVRRKQRPLDLFEGFLYIIFGQSAFAS